MTADQLAPVVSAFNPAQLLPTFLLFAPYLLGVAGIILAVSLIIWGIKSVRRHLYGGSIDGSYSLKRMNKMIDYQIRRMK